MMQRVQAILILMMFLVSQSWAAAALQVGQTDGKTLIRATAGRLAAWRPAQDVLIVVVPGDSGEIEIGSLPGGVTADKLQSGGVNGVVVTGITGSWQVVADGANWLVRPGPGLKPESVLMLRDGWHVGTQTLKPQVVTAMGKQWQVALVDSPHSVAGSVAGVVRLAQPDLPVLAEVPSAPAKLEMTKAETSKPVVAKTEPVAVAATPALVKTETKTEITTETKTEPMMAKDAADGPLVLPRSDGQGSRLGEPSAAAATLPALPTDKKVAVEAAEPLRPLGATTLATSALPLQSPGAAKRDALKAVSFNSMLARIEPAEGDAAEPAHEPAHPLPLKSVMTNVNGMAVEGRIVTAPLNVQDRFQTSGLAAVRADEKALAHAAQLPSGGLAKVAVRSGPAMRPMGLGGVQSELLPQILGDIYMPGTVISLTEPGADAVHGEAKPQVETVDQVVSGTVPTGEASPSLPEATQNTWNQQTLAPIAAELAAEKAKRDAVPPVVTPTVAPPVETVAEAPKYEAPQVSVNRILPNREGKFIDAQSDALLAITEAVDGSPRAHDGQMNLAAFYLAWQRPEEALSVLRELPQRADKLPANPLARLYMAMAQVAREQKPDAGLFDQGGQLGAHAKLWRAVAASQAGDYATALKQWPQERGILPQYPSYLRELAQKAQATALVMVGDRAVATQVVDELVNGYDKPADVPVALTRLQGLVRLGTPEEAKGLEYLAAAAEDMRDPAQAYRAKFEFVKALQQRKDLSSDQVRTYLNDLWFDWRGDDLERDVLSTLADLYDKAGQPREALHYWQTLVRAYPNAENLGGITERMTDAFLKVFDPENPTVYDTLAYIGLYYDFSELLPNDARGDVVQEQMARLLTQANLWKRAIPILEQQLQHRPLDAAAQARLVLMLAEAYNNTGASADGIKLLDKWEHVATTDLLKRAWKVQEANLMLKLNRPQNATRALAGLPDTDAEVRDLRIDAAWAAQDWPGSIALLQDKLAHVPASQLVSDTGAQLATFRLAYAFGQQHDGPQLDSLGKRFTTGLTQLPQLADGFGAVAAGTGVSASFVATGPLAPITTALNDLNRMTDQVQATRDMLDTQRKQQQEYNDKMRYMDLLPPPAI